LKVVFDEKIIKFKNDFFLTKQKIQKYLNLFELYNTRNCYTISNFYYILWIYITVFEHINLIAIKHRNINTTFPKQTCFKHKALKPIRSVLYYVYIIHIESRSVVIFFERLIACVSYIPIPRFNYLKISTCVHIKNV